MENNKNTSVLVLAITLLLVALIAAYTANSYWQKKLIIEAVDGCNKAGTSKWIDQNNNNTEISEPYLPAYEKCMKEKGY